jgi:glycosyltransferase involved in cell wall biosynthesis
MRVSVIIPFYNLGAYLEEAVSSVFASDYPEFELILIDDGSTDPDAQEALRKCEARWGADPRWRFIRQENRGLAATRNEGCRQAVGEAILPVDADNRIRPDYLSKAVDCLQKNPEVAVVYAWAQRFGLFDDVWKFQPLDRRAMLLQNGVEACSVFRKSAWAAVGGFNEEHFQEGYEDWDFWLSLIERGFQFELVPEVLFDYRVRADSMVSKCNEPEVRRKLIQALVTRHHGLYAEEWPALLVERDVDVLEHHLQLAEYRRYHIEALMEFNRVAQALTDRVNHMEAELGRVIDHAGEQDKDLHKLFWLHRIIHRLRHPLEKRS